jgi:arsenate reductase (thioredoxin)
MARKRREPKRILFVCIKNASRSQMAEALARLRKPSGVEIHSAGIEPGDEVHPNAVKAMRELGYDLFGHECNHISDFKAITFDVVAKMDVESLHDNVKAKWVEHWLVPDPANGGMQQYRKVRDELAERVGRLLDELGD